MLTGATSSDTLAAPVPILDVRTRTVVFDLGLIRLARTWQGTFFSIVDLYFGFNVHSIPTVRAVLRFLSSTIFAITSNALVAK